jgi:hypothetical protein
MPGISWTCPHCGRPVTLTESNVSEKATFHNVDNAQQKHAFLTTVYVCPNPQCDKYAVRFAEHHANGHIYGTGLSVGELIHEWDLVPPSRARVLPNYIPSGIIDDYTEACLIVKLSPKASATMARRCLQGMIRDFFHVSKNRLIDEIEAIKDKVDLTTWQAIDAVRSIGNIGAHMEKDINVIVDVDSGEADELIALIEMLIDDWYVNRHKRQEQLKVVLAIKEEKQKAKHP